MLLSTNNAERAFLYAPGVNDRLVGDDVPDDLLAECRWLHLAGYYLTMALCQDPLPLLARARHRNLPISLGLAWTDRDLWDRLDASLPYLDLLFCNRVEAARLTGARDPGLAALELRRRGPGVVIVTAGADGAYCHGAHGAAHCPGFAAEVVDTTGAGDSFNAGCLASIASRGWPAEPKGILEMLRWGCAAGALSTMAKGGLGRLDPGRLGDLLG